MQVNETVPETMESIPETTEFVVDPTEPVQEEPEQVYTIPSEESENSTYEVMIVDVQRPFLETDFMDYTVSEGLLLLIFVVVLLQFFYNLVRR